MSDFEKIIRKFIFEGNVTDKLIGNLFYNIYPNDYVYDSDREKWFSINKYGIYISEGNELLSARTKIRDELIEIYSKYYSIIIKDLKGYEREVCIKSYSLFLKAISSVKNRKLIIEDLKEKYKVNKFLEKENNNKYLFAFENGIFDMKTFEFRNAKPEELVTLTCGYNYSKSTNEMKINVMKMISDIFIQKELRTYVLKTISLRLIAINTLEEFYFWIGQAGAGKGLLTRLIENTFGNYAKTLNVETFMKNKHGVHAEAASPALASIHNSRIVFVNELKKQMKLLADLIKKLSGGDKIKARFLRQDTFEFIAQFALFFISNYEPEIDGDDSGIQRRFRYVNFLTKFLDNPNENNKFERLIDRSLKEKIETIEYKCAFFDILIEYYKDFIKNNNTLIPPKCVIDKTNSYLNENNPIKNFFEEMIEITNNNNDIVYSSKLYEEYLIYHENNSRGYDRTKFKSTIIEVYKIKCSRNKNGIYYGGIKLKENNIQNDENNLQIEFLEDEKDIFEINIQEQNEILDVNDDFPIIDNKQSKTNDWSNIFDCQKNIPHFDLNYHFNRLEKLEKEKTNEKKLQNYLQSNNIEFLEDEQFDLDSFVESFNESDLQNKKGKEFKGGMH